MTFDVEKLKQEFPEYTIGIDPDDPFEETLYISGLKGEPSLTFVITDADDLKFFRAAKPSEIELLPDIAALSIGDAVYVFLRLVGAKPFAKRSLPKQLTVQINHRGLPLLITIGRSPNDLRNFYNLARGNHLFSAKIEGLKEADVVRRVDSIKEVLDSVLFDVMYTYLASYEPVSTDSSPTVKATRTAPTIPETPVVMTYKRYIPELLEYLRTALSVDVLPFKYLCLYNIIEYFLDKSAYSLLSQQVKKALLSPDFSARQDHYLSQLVTTFRKESMKHLTDKNKIARVLEQYLDADSLKENLASISLPDEAISLADWVQQDTILKCRIDLVLKKVDFTSQSQFLASVAARIFSTRCSIVHSNPEFDEEKAIPFTSTKENLAVLAHELYFLREIAVTIISKTSVS